MNPLLSTSTKVLLAAVVVAGLLPLAEAHTCQPGVYSVDPAHRIILICNLLVCWGPPHTCVPRIADGLLADPLAPLAPLLP